MKNNGWSKFETLKEKLGVERVAKLLAMRMRDADLSEFCEFTANSYGIELLTLKIYKMKKNVFMFVLMCIGACAIDSEGWAFVLACVMVLVPAIVIIAGELCKNSANVSANIPEDVLVDYATRNDMSWEGGLI